MKKIILILLLLILLPIKIYAIECKSSGHTIMNIYFSPYGGATDAIEAEINKATKNIKVMGYSFSSPVIIEALKTAQKRGAIIEIILDKSQKTNTVISSMVTLGIKVYIDWKHTIMHNKVMIFDDDVVKTGSFNYSVSAEIRNAENIIFIRKNKCVINTYKKEFETHKEHSEYVQPILVGEVR